MLEWSVHYAARAQLQAVRVDVWRTAHKLHRWYRQHGWTTVRTVELPHRKSGTLFERAATRILLPNVCEIPSPRNSGCVFGSLRGRTGDLAMISIRWCVLPAAAAALLAEW
jgi:hypothetical protein